VATKTFYGQKNEISDAEQLLIDIDSKQYPKKENQMVKIVKGLKMLDNSLGEKDKTSK